MDGYPAPYIIMPFIANGSLLAYIKKEKTNLVVPKEADDELASSLIPPPKMSYNTSSHYGLAVLLLWIPLKAKPLKCLAGLQ